MPRGTQAKLPATVPTPTEARSRLRMALADFKAKRAEVIKQKLDLKADQTEVDKCQQVFEQVEQDWLAADDGSPEELTAGKLLLEATRAVEKAERARDTLASGMPYLTNALKQAELALSGARGDVRAIAEGRRSG